MPGCCCCNNHQCHVCLLDTSLVDACSMVRELICAGTLLLLMHRIGCCLYVFEYKLEMSLVDQSGVHTDRRLAAAVAMVTSSRGA